MVQEIWHRSRRWLFLSTLDEFTLVDDGVKGSGIFQCLRLCVRLVVFYACSYVDYMTYMTYVEEQWMICNMRRLTTLYEK